MKKQFLSSIPETMEIPQVIRGKALKSLEPYLYILAVFFGMLILYAMARIISLQRRVRDLEARPPVDDITLRGAVRLQLNDLVSDLEQSIRAKQSVPDNGPSQKHVMFDSKFHDQNHNYNNNTITEVAATVDKELNEVLEIANSVKASLPDVTLFANAMKLQKKQQIVGVEPGAAQDVSAVNDTHTLAPQPQDEKEKGKEKEAAKPEAEAAEASEEEKDKESEKGKDKRWSTPVLKRDKKKTQPPPTFKAGSKRKGAKAENELEVVDHDE